MDPAEWLAEPAHHLWRDVVHYYHLIEALAPTAVRGRWAGLTDVLLARMTDGIPRAMSLGTSMSRYIRLARQLPEPARLGVRGQVGIEFTVERGGKISRLSMITSSGMNALDRAASNALQGSDLLPLPEDYPAGSVTMRVTFVY